MNTARRAGALLLTVAGQRHSSRPYLLSGALAAVVLNNDSTAHQEAEIERARIYSGPDVVELDGGTLCTADLYKLSKGGHKIRLSQNAYDKVMDGRNVVDTIVSTDEVDGCSCGLAGVSPRCRWCTGSTPGSGCSRTSLCQAPSSRNFKTI